MYIYGYCKKYSIFKNSNGGFKMSNGGHCREHCRERCFEHGRERCIGHRHEHCNEHGHGHGHERCHEHCRERCFEHGRERCIEHGREHGHRRQKHDHEFVGSVELAERGEDRHNHRFCTISSEAISIPCGSHIHEISVNTDFYENHHHKIVHETGPAICVGHGKHVHFVCGHTTREDGHTHEFQAASLIDDPLIQKKHW